MDTVLTPTQYSLVFNMMSLTAAGMAAAGIFFLASRDQVATKYRPALVVSAVVVFIAAYHYFMMLQSWAGAYAFEGGQYTPAGKPFNDAYRYADWLITVPLLMVELIAVMGLSKSESKPLFRNLVVASVAMIALGYPGEMAESVGARWFYWTLAMIPFAYILYALVVRVNAIVANESEEVRALLTTTRTILLASWWVYPVAYVLPVMGLTSASGEVALQVGYSIADLTAKALFGIFIYRVAKAKSDDDRQLSANKPQAIAA